MILSLVGTVVLMTLFLFELQAYMTVTSTTELIVDELVDEVLRVNFNVSLHQVSLSGQLTFAACALLLALHESRQEQSGWHWAIDLPPSLCQVPCEYVSLDVSDMTGMNSHNITKDILKWRLDDKQVRTLGLSCVCARAVWAGDQCFMVRHALSDKRVST